MKKGTRPIREKGVDGKRQLSNELSVEMRPLFLFTPLFCLLILYHASLYKTKIHKWGTLFLSKVGRRNVVDQVARRFIHRVLAMFVSG
jgi:hypothetical protein